MTYKDMLKGEELRVIQTDILGESITSRTNKYKDPKIGVRQE